VDRIKRIDPRFDPQLLEQLAGTERTFEGIDEDADPPAASELLAGFSAAPLAAAPMRPPTDAQVAAPSPRQVVSDIANPGVEHVEYAAAIRRSLPPILTAAAHMRERAIDVVLSLLVARERDPASHLAEIAHRLGSVRARGTEELLDLTRSLHPAQRAPLAQLAMPALKRRPAAELRQLVDTLETLIHSDGRIEVFEYVLARLLRQQLNESLAPSEDRGARAKLNGLRREALSLLAVLAHHGHNHTESAQRAFAAGVAALFPGDGEVYAPPADWVGALDRALPALDTLVPAGKEMLVLALATTVGHDGQIAIAEAELLRLTCALLHCPLPPIL
jgi:hypothetical protein